jgi:hypothetical protein
MSTPFAFGISLRGGENTVIQRKGVDLAKVNPILYIFAAKKKYVQDKYLRGTKS